MIHYFDVEIAMKHGIEASIILSNIAYWMVQNKANDKNIHDGKTWTYNSSAAFAKVFPYMNPQKIRRILHDLEDKNILLSGVFNKITYDRTKWYTIIDECIIQKLAFESYEMNDGKLSNEQPIPDSKPNSKLNNKKEIYKENKKIKENEFLPLAKQLSNIVQTKKNVIHTKNKVHNWCSYFVKLEKEGITQDRMKVALDWYSNNIGKDYVPVVGAGESFYKKFLQLEDAIQRDKNKGNNNSYNSVKGNHAHPDFVQGEYEMGEVYNYGEGDDEGIYIGTGGVLPPQLVEYSSRAEKWWKERARRVRDNKPLGEYETWER